VAIKIEYIPTDEMVPDGLIKPLEPSEFLRSSSTIGLAPCAVAVPLLGAGKQESMDIHPVGGSK